MAYRYFDDTKYYDLGYYEIFNTRKCTEMVQTKESTFFSPKLFYTYYVYNIFTPKTNFTPKSFLHQKHRKNVFWCKKFLT